MANVAFDTLTASKNLRKAGLGLAEAEAVALVVKDSQGDLATKTDIERLEAKVTADNERLEAKVTADNEQLQAKVTADIGKLHTEFNARISNVETGLTWLKWAVGVQVAVMIGGFGITAAGFGILLSRLPPP